MQKDGSRTCKLSTAGFLGKAKSPRSNHSYARTCDSTLEPASHETILTQTRVARTSDH